MFLKSITLKGFKSFAEPTVMSFEPGVTVVVGPNGSGKSNVVDAIAWVLGAQAPSAVRSQKMDDVIFAGTAKRPALGRAEVSLTIDNSRGTLPIEFTEVTISRTLFRTGESEYALNGVPCRLLDIQELLSDAGVGRQQHVIVSQGQIDAVLNARPEDRRAVIEEAAGVLKFRRRKEKAERRLEATEANLLRVQDLLREVRRQLRPLERQAEAARRHAELADEYQVLRVFLAGREIAGYRTRLTALAADKLTAESAERELKGELARLDTQVLAAEAELAARGDHDIGDRLLTVEQLRERARGIAALLAERRRSMERDHGHLMDAGVVANLEAEAARLAAELEEVRARIERAAPEWAALLDDEAELAAEREQAPQDVDPGGTERAAAGAAAEVRGELRTLRSALDATEAEARRAGDRAAELAARIARVEADSERERAACITAEAEEAPLVEALEAAEQRRSAALSALQAATAGRDEVSAAHARWQARADALALALDHARSRAGAQALADVPGVLGTLLDHVSVDEGWEAAFEAAAGEALLAVLVEDPQAARRAIQHLAAGDGAGAVIALADVAGTQVVGVVPAGTEPVRAHVRAADPRVEALLQRLLGASGCVDGGWQAALDVALANPGAVVVTRSGDRFAAHGWRLGAGGTGATASALEDAQQQARRAAASLEKCQHDVRHAVAEADEAGAAVTAAARRLEDHDARFAAATEALSRLQSERSRLGTELGLVEASRAELHERATREREHVAELEAVLPALEADEAAEAEAARSRHERRSRLDARAVVLAGRRKDLDVRHAALEERRQFLEARLIEAEQRLAADVAARDEAESRRQRLQDSIAAIDRLAALVDGHRITVEAELATLHEARRRQSDEVRAISERLDTARRRRAAAERELDGVRERARRAELDEAEARMRLETAVEHVRRDLDTEPDAAITAPHPELPEGVGAAARVRDLEREIRLLGPINPLALEEFNALQERHHFLESELEDVKETRRELNRVIKAVDEEIQSVFAAAFADVSANFQQLFTLLFPGGTGALVLTNPEDLLSTGIEVEAKPSGKNVKKLSLLSGGERSLTALAFLFAVFRSRPSPFYVMDEVEAALDDVNLHRFLGLLAEFREEAQLVVVSHQKRTMEAGDVLLGVTMQPGGSSKVVVERVSTTASP